MLSLKISNIVVNHIIMKVLKSAMLLLSAVAMVSCGQKQEPKERYCGKDISGFEVMDLKKLGETYKFTEADNKLALDVQNVLTKMAADKKAEIEVGMIVHDKERIGFYIIVPEDPEIIEASSCYLLQNDMGGRLPKSRKLLFYAKDHNSLLAAITNKD